MVSNISQLSPYVDKGIYMSNVIKQGEGILFEKIFLNKVFNNKEISCINKLREKLIIRFPNLREKINKSSQYFGFSTSDNSDSFYIYLQKKKMIMDINIPYAQKEKLLIKKFTIIERQNYQFKMGWITGIHIDYDCNQIEDVFELAVLALSTNT